MNVWSYTILFAGVGVSWIGIPIVGGVALAAAGALAGDGQLNVWLVILVATAGAWTGGYLGYLLGWRAADVLTNHPGRWHQERARALNLGKRFYRRWGPLAVFLTPTWVSGALRMPPRSFLIWNAACRDRLPRGRRVRRLRRCAGRSGSTLGGARPDGRRRCCHRRRCRQRCAASPWARSGRD